MDATASWRDLGTLLTHEASVLAALLEAVADPSSYIRDDDDALAERGTDEPHEESGTIALIDPLRGVGELAYLGWKADTEDVIDLLMDLPRVHNFRSRVRLPGPVRLRSRSIVIHYDLDDSAVRGLPDYAQDSSATDGAWRDQARASADSGSPATNAARDPSELERRFRDLGTIEAMLTRPRLQVLLRAVVLRPTRTDRTLRLWGRGHDLLPSSETTARSCGPRPRGRHKSVGDRRAMARSPRRNAGDRPTAGRDRLVGGRRLDAHDDEPTTTLAAWSVGNAWQPGDPQPGDDGNVPEPTTG